MKYLLFFSVVAIVCLGASSPSRKSLQYDEVTETAKKSDDTLHYFFAGHTYDYHSYGPAHRVDRRIQDLDYSKFSRIWLGGDISSAGSFNWVTMQYLDSVFDLSNPRTQYSMGNHDIRDGNIQVYRDFTKRKTYNVTSENGVVSICMNSQLNPNYCEDLNLQFQMIKNVCDTIQNSSHLFVFMHSCLFYGSPGISHPGNFAHTNYMYWNANCSSSTQTFSTAIYPLLKQVEDSGIDVYVIMGDSGTSTKQWHEQSTDSIDFFASGIGNSKYLDSADLALQDLDRVLVFEHVLPTQEITWSFQDLDSLSAL